MLEALIETYGDPLVLFGGGLAVGLLFGALAQHSRFCLRSATIEFSTLTFGPKLAIWLLTFSAAVIVCQWAILTGRLELSQARQIAAIGSISGALIGGLMFGIGMILARGCASRLLVLSATGNLRALVTGLVLTVVAQAALRGVLAPAREGLAALWLVPGGAARDLLAHLGLTSAAAATLAALALAGGVALAVLRHVRSSHVLAGIGV